MRTAATHTHRIWRGVPSWQRLALVMVVALVALVQFAGSSPAVTPGPDQIGQWSAPTPWPIVAVHMSLEPNGQVLAIDAWDAAVNTQRLWDPTTGNFTPVPYGRNLFCAGHVQLPDGRTLLVGGNVQADDGLADTTIFDSKTDTYTRAPDMSVARWYPTATVLPDGRVLTFSGDNIVQDRPGATHPFKDASVNSLPEIYNPKTNSWTDLTSARLTSPLYPFMFVLSNGKVFDAGPDTTTRILDPDTQTWTTVGTSPIDGMSAVMYRPNKIMKAGTWADPDFYGADTYNADGRTAVIDMSQATPTWRETAPMNIGRSYQNMTLLPDGTVLASGGMTTSDGTTIANGVLPAEIWNPDTETWTQVASLTNPREYHSTALLLPDGRVLMAGGGGLPGRAVDETNGEIYSPPYLFKGARPTISASPAGASWGSSFDVTTPDAASISKVSLIRVASVTHAFDQNQRFQFLNFTAGSGKITVQAPANANLAPPGDYLLFILNGSNVPSTGKFIRLSASSDTTPPTAPTGLNATPAPGQVALSWNASTDSSGIANYSVYRSTTSGFTPSASNRIAQPTGTSYTDSNVSPGTYYYKVTADDTAGNTSSPSNEASATVTGGGPPPGLVAAWGFDEGNGTSTADQSGHGNNGTLSNATWSTGGKFGNALSFNGTNSFVSVPDSASLDVTTGLTIEGWVKPTGATQFRTLLVKETNGNLVYGLYANSDTNRPQSQVTVGSPRLLDGTATLPANAWSHVAMTFDGTTQRLFVNGTQVSQVAVSGSIATSTGPLKIGGNAIWGEFFSGLIDELRVYNRALSATEITTDMNTSISAPDSTPPSAPGTLTATGGLGQVSLSWGAATDNVGVAKYDVYRSTTSGFTPSASNRIAQPTGLTYTDSGLTAGTTYYYRVQAEDAVGNTGASSNEANAVPTADTTPPTAPGSLTATGAPGKVTLGWNASTDAGGIARYSVYRSTTSGFTPSAGNRIAQPTTTSYVDNGLAAGTYFYKVTADDNAGNTSSPSNEASATVGTAPPAGLVAAYGMDAGSGTTLVDQSGNNNNGTISNATWSTLGKYGNALSFNGTNASVSIPDSASLDATTGLTIEGWVNPNSGGGFRTLAVKETSGNLVYGLYANSDSNRPQSQVTVGTPRLLDGTNTVPAGLWTHLAMTFDGTTQRLYVNGTQVSSSAISGSITTSTGALKIGGNSIWGEWFSGLIDEVRVYSRALSAAEITTDMNTSISSPDTTPPSAPGTLTATGGLGQVSLSWGAATDNKGVTKYDVYRSTTQGFTPSASNRIAQPTGLTYTDSGLTAGTTYYYRVAAEDAAGNVGPNSNEANAVPTADTTPPTTPGSLTATGAPGKVTLGWNASTDAGGIARYNVYRSTTSGFTPSASNRIAQPTTTSYVDNGLAAGTYFYKVTADDNAGNTSSPSNEASATVPNGPPAGLVAAYGMDAGSGTTLVDQSGNNNNGTISNATWSASGKFGSALSFNGTNASVTIPDSSSLDATTGLTIEGWVNPNAGSGFRTLAVKETSGDLVYGLYANSDSNRPQSQVSVGGPKLLNGTSALPTGSWSHVAMTYDGTTQRLYVNGTQVASSTVSGSIATSTGALKIGGNSIWGEWFNGLIDEVRVYSRALSAAEVTTDMNTSISAPDTTPPTAPGSLTATGGLGQISLSWGAATDNVGVAKYDLYRSTTQGFTPSAANRIAQPAGVTYNDTGLTPGTYYYRVAAEDAAGNLGPNSNEASGASTADTTPPTVSITAPASGATVSGSVSVNANASDNGSVAGVQFKLDGSNLGSEDTSSPYTVSWDTTAASNGSHTLTAVARDGAGNTTTSSSVPVTVSNTAIAGLVGAWAFDEGTGTTTADQSGKSNNGTVSNTTWVTTGKFNNALSFNGSNAWVTVPDSSTLDLTTGMTVEAWVKPSSVGSWQTAVVKEQAGDLVYGIYANTSSNRPEAQVYVNGAVRAVDGTAQVPAGSWTHLAATYDGTTLRLYVNGTQAGQLAVSGSILTSTQPVRIGGNNIWGERFNGLIDEVRIYNRALTAAQIQNDMVRSITPDVTPPTVTAKTPASGAAGINVGTSPTVTFNEAMDPTSITSSTIQLKNGANSVATNVTYDAATNKATITPQAALTYGATYTVTVKGGAGGVTDLAGNPLAADSSWSFSTESSPPQILVVTSTSNLFGGYLAEILRGEGVDAFTTIDASFLSPSLLSGFDVVLLGDMTLNSSQVTTLTNWVNGGGNLIAMHPDKQLAGLLGLTDAGSTLANAYLKIDTTQAPGAGIVSQTIQYHGTADRYTLNGATAVATLYSNASTATSNPAVTLRSVGSNGGQAAAFTFDLARSIVYTREGNPAWAGQDRDGFGGFRPNDLFYGAKSGDVQPDWLDTSKIAIPQADEQQRLLVNMMTMMERDKLPLPHFWYLPRGLKAVVAMSGDDHSPTYAPGGTASNFAWFEQQSAPGCVVALWQCIRTTSYLITTATITNAQAASYLADGFEIALHPLLGACPPTAPTEADLTTAFDQQLAQWQARYPSIPPPVTTRTHCVAWSSTYVGEAKVEAAHGMRMDGNYYHYPASWLGSKPGFLTGGGFPQRFADQNGQMIDIYQENTNMTDESGQSYPATVNTLLDNALGPLGYYGAFGTNIHTDEPAPLPDDEAIVASAQARNVPIINYKQLLDWTDGRNASTIRSMSWNNGTFTFTTTVGSGATGLQTMLPTAGPSGTLSALSCGGSPKTYTVLTIKGVQYAMFDAVTGTCQATYS